MAYADIPEKYQPPAVRSRADAIAATLTDLDTASRTETEKDQLFAEFVENQNNKLDGCLNELIKAVIERGGDSGQIKKARAMIEMARIGLPSEMLTISQAACEAAELQAAVSLGLEYFAQNPALFLDSLGTNPRPNQHDLNRISDLMNIPTIARTQYVRTLPAPAALAALAVFNALNFVLQIEKKFPQLRLGIPFHMSIAAAWNYIGHRLAEDTVSDTKSAAAWNKAGADWPPPWLVFLEDIEF